MKSFFLALLMCVYLLNNTFAQKEYNVSAPMIEVVDSNFLYILDYVFELDKNCNYFSDSLWYSIMVSESFDLNEKYIVFQFEGNLNKGTYLEFVNSDAGVLKYGNHYFFIRGNAFQKEILKITNNQHSFNGYFDKPSFHIDDSWALHVIGYHDGEYYFIQTANDNVRCK